MESQEWPADIDDLIEFWPQLEEALNQLTIQYLALKRPWNARLSRAENYARIPGLEQLDNLCTLYDQRIGRFPEELRRRMHSLSMAELLERQRAYELTQQERSANTYQCAAERRLRGLFSDLMNFRELLVRSGDLDHLKHIDF